MLVIALIVVVYAVFITYKYDEKSEFYEKLKLVDEKNESLAKSYYEEIISLRKELKETERFKKEYLDIVSSFANIPTYSIQNLNGDYRVVASLKACNITLKVFDTADEEFNKGMAEALLETINEKFK